MADKDRYDAAREAMRGVTDRPELTASDQQRLLRYLGGVAYRDQRMEAREQRDVRTHRGGPAMTTARTWNVEIFIDEHEDDRRTHAEARLNTRDRTGLAGEGFAMRKPSDTEVPEIGDELAAARALADLSHRLMEAAAADIEQMARQR